MGKDVKIEHKDSIARLFQRGYHLSLSLAIILIYNNLGYFLHISSLDILNSISTRKAIHWQKSSGSKVNS